MLRLHVLLMSLLLFAVSLPHSLVASEYTLPEQDETWHFLRKMEVPRLEVGAGIEWRDWSRDTDVGNSYVQANSSMRLRDQSFATVLGGFRADWLRLSGKYAQGIEEINDDPSWDLLARMDIIMDSDGYSPMAIRLEADVTSHEGDVDYTIDGENESSQERRRTQRYSLNFTGGDWRFAGSYFGLFYEIDETPTAVTYLQGGNLNGFGTFDPDFKTDKWGIHAGYDWLENRAWRRGSYLGPFIGGRMSWSYIYTDSSSSIEQEALAETDTDYIVRDDYWQWDGRVNAGFMWQDGSRKSGGTVFQIAAGGEVGWLILFESTYARSVDNQAILHQFDMDGWELRGFAQAKLIF